MGPLFYGIYERDISDRYLDAYPELYREVRKGLYWNNFRLMYWFMTSVLHAGLIYLSVYFANYEGALDNNGYSTGYWVQAYLFSTPMLLVVLSKNMAMTRFWIWPIFLGLGLSILVNVATMFMLLVLDTFYYTDYATSVITHSLPGYYILSVLMPALCIVPDLLFTL